jgi:hypothetical protein
MRTQSPVASGFGLRYDLQQMADRQRVALKNQLNAGLKFFEKLFRQICRPGMVFLPKCIFPNEPILKTDKR